MMTARLVVAQMGIKQAFQRLLRHAI